MALSLTRSTVLYFEWHHTFLHDVQVSASFHSSIKFPELGTRFFILVAQVLFAKLKKLFLSVLSSIFIIYIYFSETIDRIKDPDAEKLYVSYSYGSGLEYITFC